MKCRRKQKSYFSKLKSELLKCTPKLSVKLKIHKSAQIKIEMIDLELRLQLSAPSQTKNWLHNCDDFNPQAICVGCKLLHLEQKTVGDWNLEWSIETWSCGRGRHTAVVKRSWKMVMTYERTYAGEIRSLKIFLLQNLVVITECIWKCFFRYLKF